jgi:hypothetical protein
LVNWTGKGQTTWFSRQGKHFLVAFCPFFYWFSEFSCCLLSFFIGFLLEVLLGNYSFVIVWKNSFQRKEPNQIKSK